MQPEGSQGPLTRSCYCSQTPHTTDCRVLRCADKKRAKIAPDVLRAVARNSDPETSHEAAKSVRNVGPIHEAILATFRAHAPLTDEELVAVYGCTACGPAPRASDSSIRSRRKELAVLGRVVEVGLRRLSSGRNGRVWSLPKEGSRDLD